MRDAEFRRAALIFVGLTLLWFAPCWLFQATPLPLDFIRSPFELASFIPFAMPNYFGNPRVHNYRAPAS